LLSICSFTLLTADVSGQATPIATLLPFRADDDHRRLLLPRSMPPEQWERDVSNIKRFGFEFIHVGESPGIHGTGRGKVLTSPGWIAWLNWRENTA